MVNGGENLGRNWIEVCSASPDAVLLANILHSRAESFHAWRTFATVYPGAEEFGRRRYRHLLRLRQLPLPLVSYYQDFTSPETRWHICLRVSPNQLNTQDLVSIHSILNLAILDLSGSGNEYGDVVSNFDERLMRSWAELAATGQAFQQLRGLMFGWQENLSDWLFKYTPRFPSLCYIIITDCPKLHQRNRAEWEPAASAAGWEAQHAKRSAKSLRPILTNSDFHLCSISELYYQSQEVLRQLPRERRTAPYEDRPLLEAWLGSPRLWSHIIEDFPGHRTSMCPDSNPLLGMRILAS
jgi:hypothetical protein